MKKILTINRTDEYRAKIQKEEIGENDFFYDVFCRARKILDEIVTEQQKFLADLKEVKSSFKRIKGIGNNIITFSAERGQGKTSMMQSVAQKLRTESLKENVTIKYDVLDSIDPSDLETDESLVRVFISRLFFSINSKVEEEELFKKGESLQKKQELLDLFEKCFNNVDYIHSKGKKEYCQGELDYLAQLGDSSQLKENLYQLVEIYLELMFSKKDENDTFLVIQIDDADLSTAGVFQMCEEIRRYLSIPNVVILMAADFEQIYYAIYQNYLVQHKELIQQHSFLVKECRQMAAKYLEKIFPAGHSVELPKIEDFITSDDNNNILLDYNTIADAKKDPVLSMGKDKLEKMQDFKNIHQQLSRELYEKTGIIILQDNNTLHPFFPLTLREITHFTKLLYDMEHIYWDLVYFQYVTQTVDTEREKLKKNLETLMNYFMHTWIINKLQLSEKEFFGEYSNQKEISLEEYWRNREDKNLSLSGNLATACSIYLTILANQLSIAYLKEKKEQERLRMVMEDLLWISERQVNYTEKGRYQLSGFRISKDYLEKNLRKFLRIDIENIPDDENKNCLERFLCPVIDGKLARKEEIFREENKRQIRKFKWNYNIHTLELHLLNPIFSIFWKSEEVDQEELEKSDSVNDDTDEQTEEKDTENKNHTVKNERVILNQIDFRSIKEIVANGDVLCYILNIFKQKYKQMSKENFSKSWNEFYKEILKSICFDLKNKHPYLKLPKYNRLQKILDAYFVKDVMNSIFLSCNKNKEEYIRESVETLHVFINNEKHIQRRKTRSIESIVSYLNNRENMDGETWQPDILEWGKFKFHIHKSGLKTNMPDPIFEEIEKQVEGLGKVLQKEELERRFERLGQFHDFKYGRSESSAGMYPAGTLQIEEKEKNSEQRDSQNNKETGEED